MTIVFFVFEDKVFEFFNMESLVKSYLRFYLLLNSDNKRFVKGEQNEEKNSSDNGGDSAH